MSMTDSLKTLLATAGITDEAVLAKLAEKGLTSEEDIDSLSEKHLTDAGMPEIKAAKAYKKLKPAAAPAPTTAAVPASPSPNSPLNKK